MKSKAKIAILFDGDVFHPKGAINAILNRTRNLLDIADCKVDVYCIMSYENFFIRMLKRSSKTPKSNIFDYNGITVNLIWYTETIADYITFIKLRSRPFIQLFQLSCVYKRLKEYDLVCAHSFIPGLIALKAKEKYGIPFVVNWHGSEIHSSPLSNKYVFRKTKEIIDKADMNFFVSKALHEASKTISTEGVSQILYNGASDIFRKYDIEQRAKLRHKYGLSEGDKVVTFVGNLFYIKNADLLPDIFVEIKKKYKGLVKFWIVGDGKLRPIIQQKLDEFGLTCCTLWGNQKPDIIPEYLNCTDVLVLPSKNEGLPLVTVEALKCGAFVVGANVGGIIEVVGSENVIDHGRDFISKFSERVTFFLNHPEYEQVLPDCFDWKKTARQELEYLDGILK